jgi:hypothetical protein
MENSVISANSSDAVGGFSFANTPTNNNPSSGGGGGFATAANTPAVTNNTNNNASDSGIVYVLLFILMIAILGGLGVGIYFLVKFIQKKKKQTPRAPRPPPPSQPGQLPPPPSQPGQLPPQPSQPGQRPPQPGQRPPQPGQRPPQPGQRPPQPGQRPPQPGQRPPQLQKPPQQQPAPKPPAPIPAPGPPSGPAPTGVLQLGVPPLDKSGAPWNVTMVQKNSLAKISIVDGNLQVVYPAKCGGDANPKKKCGSSAGLNMRASPSCCFPATAMQFGYSVYFPADFNFQNSGKCPGMWIGDPKASGGSWLPKGGSVRLMWRTDKGGKNPYFIGYLYIPTEVGGSQKAAVAKQNIPDAHQSGGGRTGLDLWQRTKKSSGPSPFPIKSGAWNDVVLTVGLNAVGQSDGYITLQVNGNSQSYRNMTWRTSDLKLSGVMLASWFGGSDQKRYGSPKDETALFRNFWLKKLA